MNVATYLSCYFQHRASPGPVLEESLPAVVVLVEHPASPGPLLEEILPAVVVLVEHPASPSPLLEESLPAVVVLVEQLTLTDHMLKALIGWIHHTRDDQLDECHCGMPPYLMQSVHFHHAVVWPFRLGVVFCLFGGFQSFFGGFILFRSWMALIFILFLLDIFFRTPLSTEQPGQSEGSLSHDFFEHKRGTDPNCNLPYSGT